ncbi:MAG TPA: hypothetical protein VIN59_00975 [Alphaproteobacteria bacterium]
MLARPLELNPEFAKAAAHKIKLTASFSSTFAFVAATGALFTIANMANHADQVGAFSKLGPLSIATSMAIGIGFPVLFTKYRFLDEWFAKHKESPYYKAAQTGATFGSVLALGLVLGYVHGRNIGEVIQAQNMQVSMLESAPQVALPLPSNLALRFS